MKSDKEGNIKLNWLERKLADERFGYAFLFGLGFTAAYFYSINNLVFKLFFGAEVILFNKFLSLIIIPMIVGGVLGLSFMKLIEIKMDYRRRRQWLNRRK